MCAAPVDVRTCNLNRRGRAAAGPLKTLTDILLYAIPVIPVAVHPKPTGVRGCGAAPRKVLNGIPLYAVPSAVTPPHTHTMTMTMIA